jgi:hypothetical protein
MSARHAGTVSRANYDSILANIASVQKLLNETCSKIDDARKETENERKLRHELYHAHAENCKEKAKTMQAKIIELQQLVGVPGACVADGGNVRKRRT